MNRLPETDHREPIKLDLALEVLETFGQVRLPVTGASMLPSLWPGDVLTIQSLRGQGIEAVVPGDLVLARRDGRLVVHRVVRCSTGTCGTGVSPVSSHGRDGRATALLDRVRSGAGVLIVTRGDRLDHADPPVAAEDLLGRVTAITRGDRLISPRQTLAGRLAAWLLRRSDFATRTVLYLRRCQVSAARLRLLTVDC